MPRKWRPKVGKALGERTGNTNLTKEDVIAIRENPLPASALCRMYGLSAEQIRKIRRGESWAWVKEGLDYQEDVADQQVAELRAIEQPKEGTPEWDALKDREEAAIKEQAERMARLQEQVNAAKGKS